MMTIGEFRANVKKHEIGGGLNYVEVFGADDEQFAVVETITLDGQFTLEQLRQITREWEAAL